MIFRKAVDADISQIWDIIQFAIERRKLDGSDQWQDGYPNLDSIRNDLDQGWAYVMSNDQGILAYGAVSFDHEPAYEDIIGAWLSAGDYVVASCGRSTACSRNGYCDTFFYSG